MPLYWDLCRWILWIFLDPFPLYGLVQSMAIEPFLWCTLDQNSVYLVDVSVKFNGKLHKSIFTARKDIHTYISITIYLYIYTTAKKHKSHSQTRRKITSLFFCFFFLLILFPPISLILSIEMNTLMYQLVRRKRKSVHFQDLNFRINGRMLLRMPSIFLTFK